MRLQYLSRTSRISNYSVIPNELFALNLSSTAMVLYSKLLNRAALSAANGRADAQGRICIFYKLEELSRELRKSISTIKMHMNELVEAGLIEKKRSEKGRANVILIKIPESSLTAGKSAVQGPENKPFIGQKTDCSRVRKPAPNNYKNNKENNNFYIYGEDTF